MATLQPPQKQKQPQQQQQQPSSSPQASKRQKLQQQSISGTVPSIPSIPTTTVLRNATQPPPPKTIAPSVEMTDAERTALHFYRQQLLTEHFGFAPLSFVDDVINSANNLIYQASMGLQSFIEQRVQDPEESAKGMHQFETLLESAVDKNFDRFEVYAFKSLFGVTEKVDIVLPHYDQLDFNISSEIELEQDQELNKLRRQVAAAKVMNFRLQQNLDRVQKQQERLIHVQEQVQDWKMVLKELEDVAPVPQTLTYIRQNLETLFERFRFLDESILNATTNAAASGGSSLIQPQQSISTIEQLQNHLAQAPPDPRSQFLNNQVAHQIEKSWNDMASGNTMAADSTSTEP